MTMTRVAWFQCSAGVAGDMVMAALVDAASRAPQVGRSTNGTVGVGAPVDRAPVDDVVMAVMSATAAVTSVPLANAAPGHDAGPVLEALTFEPVQRCGVQATWANVVVHTHNDPSHDHQHTHEHEHVHGHERRVDASDTAGSATHDGLHRPARDVLAMIHAAGLDDRTRERATAVYGALANVEGHIHGIDPAEVELHEVGAIDSIVDVVGACAALEAWGVDAVVFSPIAVGHGTVNTQHGTLANPVPAVVNMLARYGAPSVGLDTTMEVATPTGVALMCVLSSTNPDGVPRPGAMPPMRVIATGNGAGTADVPGRPNVVQVVIGEIDVDTDATISAADATGDTRRAGSTAIEVCVNVDDVTGEVLAHTIDRLLDAGAVDAWVTPIVMKKGRPAHTVHALCDEARLAMVRDTMVTETGSLGVRAHVVRRWPQQRHEVTVTVEGEPIRVKIASALGRADVEFDDAARVAAATGVPVRDIISRAEAIARDAHIT